MYTPKKMDVLSSVAVAYYDGFGTRTLGIQGKYSCNSRKCNGNFKICFYVTYTFR